MYLINPYISGCSLKMEAFIAPAAFDADAQELNIFKKFCNYYTSDANAAYIFSFTSAIAALSLTAATGVTYVWGETISGIDFTSAQISSGTAFTSGSTKRWVLVYNTSSSVAVTAPTGAVWIYGSDKCYSYSSSSNTYLKYVHCNKLNSVTYIPINAFVSCTGLSGNLTIPSICNTIETSSFQSCTGLTNIYLHSGITTIKNLAFYNCTNAYFNSNNLILPNLATIGDSAFSTCKNLKNVDISSSSITTLGTSAGVFFQSGITSILLPDTLVSIGAQCFQSTPLSSVNIPVNLKTIGSSAFQSCTSLITVTINSNVLETIGSLAFHGCGNINSNFNLPVTIKSIGNNAFWQCYNAVFGNITANLTYLGSDAFSYCYKLYNIDLSGGSITSIVGGTGMFKNCTGLLTVKLPSSITSIGDAAFSGCSNVTYYLKSQTAPTVSGTPFGNYAKPLHIPVTNSGYNVAPWTTTTIFSSIIADL